MNDYNQRRGSHDALILCTVFVVGLFIASCSKGPPGYSDFTAHDKKYYTEIAQGCETLLSRTNRTADWWIMSGDDKTLPTALQDLNATKIKVAKHLPLETNSVTGVTIVLREERPSFVVSWGQTDNINGTGPWELSAITEVNKTVVFSK